MRVKVHRGQGQIGGNIIEVDSGKTRIILDAGLELDDNGNIELPDVESLFGNRPADALFFSHYHLDHMGLADSINPQIPMYMGEGAYKVLRAAYRYMGKDIFSIKGTLKDSEPIIISDIKITPYLADHSAYDSYMLLVECGGRKLLYTGDFRSCGWKPLSKTLSKLPSKVDVVLCEGTALSRENFKLKTEKELEEEAVSIMKEYSGPVFVLMAATNIDRIVTIYKASARTGRSFYQELYMAMITSELVDKEIPNPITFNRVHAFISRGYDEDESRYEELSKFGDKRIGGKQIASRKFTMYVRSSMLNYLNRLNEECSFDNGVLIYSMWNGYKQQPEVSSFIEACKEMGLDIVDLHTSGHADAGTITALIDKINPDIIVPIHCENPGWFLEKYQQTRRMVIEESEVQL
jgi:ribonuclease J